LGKKSTSRGGECCFFANESGRKNGEGEKKKTLRSFLLPTKRRGVAPTGEKFIGRGSENFCKRSSEKSEETANIRGCPSNTKKGEPVLSNFLGKKEGDLYSYLPAEGGKGYKKKEQKGDLSAGTTDEKEKRQQSTFTTTSKGKSTDALGEKKKGSAAGKTPPTFLALWRYEKESSLHGRKTDNE